MSDYPIPVILDTDIGADIDDTWALAMLLRSSELDLKLLTTTVGDTTTKAKIAAKMLTIAGRDDVPVGIGVYQNRGPMPQATWAEEYKLSSYRGRIYPSSVQAITETIMSSPRPVTVISIGPTPDLAAALAWEPAIASKAHFVGMHGSIHVGYRGNPQPAAEWNVKVAPAALRAVLAADWLSKTITPLDTCGLIRLTGRKYQRVLESADPLARAVIENFRAYRAGKSIDGESSTLFDCVAVYLAFARDLVEMTSVGVRVTDDGFTVPDDAAPRVDCALAWKDMEAFEDMIVKRLTGM